MKKLLSTILKVVVFFIGWALVASFLPIPETADGACWRFFAELTPLVAIVLATLIFWLIDRRQVPIKLIGAHGGRAAVLGVVTGVIWIGAAVVILALGGWLRVTGSQPVPALWLWIVALFLNTIMQELLVRGYLYQRIKKSYNIPAAAIVTTALFLFCHGGAIEAGWLPCANIVLMSLFVTAVLEYTGSLIAPIFIHFAWNSIGGVILGGVSLADDYPHMIDLTMQGSTLISGGVYKIEGNLVVLLLNAVAFVVFALLARKKKHQ